METYEHRAHRRSPIWLHVVVQSTNDGAGREGIVVDLSAGGAAVETESWPDDESHGTIGFLSDGERYLIPFEAVGVESSMRGSLVHARFEAVDERCQAFLMEQLVSFEEEFAESQRFLIRRPDNLAS